MLTALSRSPVKYVPALGQRFYKKKIFSLNLWINNPSILKKIKT
jgi:hypothetical protein